MEPENYLDIALTQWLPRRLEGSHARGLEALAGLLEERHHDRWLRDVLAVAPSERLQHGWAALGEAVAANRSDEVERAMARSREAARLLRAAGDRAGALRAEAELAYGVRRSFDAGECIAHATAVERAAAGGGYAWIRAQVLLELGICRAIQGDSGGAYRDIALARDTAKTAAYRTLELRADGILAGEQTNAGNLLVAWERSREALELFWSGAHRAERAHQIHNVLRRACEQLELWHSAHAFARAGVAALAETNHQLAEAVGRTQLARIASEAGSSDEADREYQRASSLFAGLGEAKPVVEHRLFAGIAVAEAAAQANDSDAALRKLEELREPVRRTDSLLMQLRFYQAAGDVHYRRGDLGEAEAAWRLAVDHNERRLGSLSGFEQRDAALRVADKAYRGLAATQWARTGEAADALAAWEWFRNGERPRLRRQPGLPLERLRNETLLAFAELPDAVAAWAFDDRGVTGVRLSATSGEIRRTAERFARLCADRGSELAEVRRLGRQLYEWLVAPLESRLEPDRTLVVMPDGPVAAIPFAALVDTRSRYLGERFDIVTAGSAEDYLRRAGRPAVGAGSRALIVVDPVLGADAARAFPPLPHARREGELVAARFQHSMVLAGERATLAAIEQRRPHAGVLHFAGHGFAHAGNGGLLLASGDSSTIGWEVLDGKRLGGQDWTHCRLAVLSACSAGTGEARGPVNPESLVRRLLWAGIARVVASRWRIDSRTALELMEEFYSGLLSGLDTPAALRRSGGRIRDREATRHPYYWAGFQTFGSR